MSDREPLAEATARVRRAWTVRFGLLWFGYWPADLAPVQLALPNQCPASVPSAEPGLSTRPARRPPPASSDCAQHPEPGADVYTELGTWGPGRTAEIDRPFAVRIEIDCLIPTA